MRHIHILVPSYGRPRELKRLIASALATCTNYDWTIYPLVEKDDPCMVGYSDVLIKHYGSCENVVTRITGSKGSRNCIVEQWDRLKDIVPDEDIVFTPGDDIVFASFGWDEMIVKTMPKNGMGICYCADNEVFDLLHMIMGVGLIKLVGGVMPTTINHYYTDSWWRKIALDAGIAHPIHDMFLFHLHSKVKWIQLRATVTDAYKKNNDELKKDKAAFIASYPEIEGIVQRIKKFKVDQVRNGVA